MTLVRSTGYFEGVGRIRLQYRSWEVPGGRGSLLVIHGLAEHGGRYEDFADRMAAAGFSTFILDLRGHGHSEGRRGYIRRFDVFLQDLERFRREIHGSMVPGRPVFLLGQSMGGLIGLRYVQEYEPPFQGVILSSPWLGTMMEVPRWKAVLGRLLDRVLPAFPFHAGIPADALSHDPAVVADYRRDPLVHGRITPRLFSETGEAMRLAFDQIGRIATPLLFLVAGGDRIVDSARTRAFARGIRTAPVQVRYYPDLYHDLLHELDRAVVLQDIRAWMLRRSEGVPV